MSKSEATISEHLRWKRIERIFREALEQAEDERSEFLDAACGDDAAARAEVETLLASHETGDDRWDDPRSEESFNPATDDSGAPYEPARIGPFRIIRRLGSGGMGAVYEAEQESPNRTVALKILRPGAVSTDALRRFKHESDVLARLRHPGIAQVYEAGVHRQDGAEVPYFVMELIPGASGILAYADERKLDLRQRLQLFAGVCDAVHHGHMRGIIHRDLKPANILVDSSGQTKVIDFGVARATDADILSTTMRTHVGQLVGTLAYMSPEQCQADPHHIDIRSDVYSLGVVLYEMICGCLPYDIRTKPVHEAMRIVQQESPARPSSVASDVPADLEAIVLKALEKERGRRYESAAQLVRDVRRFLHNEPIEARPPSRLYQFRLFAKRNRAIVAGATIAVAGLLMGAILATGWAIRAIRDANAATLAANRAERINHVLQRLISTADPYASGGDMTMRDVLDAAVLRLRAELVHEPDVLATLLQTIGDAYTNIGRFDQAEETLREAHAIRTEMFGDESLQLAPTLGSLGRLYQRQQRLDEAERSFRQALDLKRRLAERNDPSTAIALHDLGLLLNVKCDFDAAQPYLAEALAIQQSNLAPHDPDLLQTTITLAINEAYGLGDLAGGIEKMERALRERRGSLGASHPAAAGDLSNLALMYRMKGDFSRAARLYSEALEIQREFLPPDDPDLATLMTNLAIVLMEERRFDEAESLFRQVLEMHQRRFRDGKAIIMAIAMCNIADVLARQGRFAEAEPILREVIERFSAGKGPEHLVVQRARALLARNLIDEARYAEAEAALLEQWRVSGERDVLAANLFSTLYEEWGRDEDANLWRGVEQELRTSADDG